MKLTPKGMRDIPPKDMIIREKTMNLIQYIFRNYGYRPLDTPAMEYLETLRAKAGEEVDKQIFVLDGGEYGLRFDLTVPLARFAATTDDPKPFKRYAIGNVWRKEEPQRGRFREFYQADADIIGSSSMRCEAELLKMANQICLEFGFEKPVIMLNNRKILDGIAKSLGIENKKAEVFRILDKIDKLPEDEIEKLLRESIGNKTDELLKIIRSKGDNHKKLDIARKFSAEGAQELGEILSLCDFDIEIDLFLVRGLGYYTGPVYEIKLSKDIGTVISGGRYDNLLGVYGQESPAAGISVGIERLITLILERDPQKKKTITRIFVAAVKDEFYNHSRDIASQLRAAGISTETDLNSRNLKKQFEYVNSLGVPYVLVLGAKEIESKEYTLRDMASGEEEKLGMDAIIKKLTL
ncbi:histidine--tRNA ligase [Candidatus Micrarchaeota archaeon]|nr:histidine--tRNA ligase [Candidatus Micrarchaeota archaeon]